MRHQPVVTSQQELLWGELSSLRPSGSGDMTSHKSTMAATTPYTAPSMGCAYEEEGCRWELFSISSILNFHSPRLRHLLTAGNFKIIEEEDEDTVCGPLLMEIPRKYLIEVRPQQHPVPTAEQLAVPAPRPTLEERLRSGVHDSDDET